MQNKNTQEKSMQENHTQAKGAYSRTNGDVRALPRSEQEFVSKEAFAAKAAFVLEKARALGATDAKVYLSETQSVNLEVRDQQVEHLGFERDHGMSVTVYRGQQCGSATASDWSESALSRAVQMAYQMSQFSQPDPYLGIAEDHHHATPRDLQRYCPWDISLDEMATLAKRMENASKTDKRIVNTDGASISSSHSAYLYADSRGRSYFEASTDHGMTCVPIAQDEAGLIRGYDYTVDCRPDRLLSPETIGENAAKMAISNLGGRPIKTQRLTVVFDALVAASYWGAYCRAISGRLLYRKESFLGECQGKAIFPHFVQLEENPFIIGDRCAGWFDEEGLPTREATLIQDGTAQQYLLDLYSARRMNLAPTGHGGGVHRCFVTPTHTSQAALLKEVGSGLLVTEFMGGYPNFMTGDYSRGVSGFWFEGGIIQYPVKTVTLAGNMKDLFAGCIGIANDLNTRSGIVTGSVAMEGFTLAGI
ncbi:MAG: metallopeptidase TldD-related protein [Pseudomonadota bacterium]